MKKLLCCFLFFVVSTSIFPQEKPSFTKNFSLVKHSGNNYLNYINLNIESSFNNLSQTKEDCHSKQYLTSQVSRFYQLLERTPFLRVIFIGNRNRIRGDISNFLYGQRQEIESEEKSESLAEGHLRRLAERSRGDRKIGGIIMVALGGFCFTSGAIILSSEDSEWENDIMGKEFWGGSIAIGGILIAGGGILTMVIPSPAEKELAYVSNISALSLRESAGYEALSSFSKRGKKRRISTGLLLAYNSVIFLASSKGENLWETVLGVAYGAGAGYMLTSKTPEEKAFKRYLKERSQQIGIER